MDSFERAHAFTRRWEGGLADHPADPGGLTNHGVSLRFLRGLGTAGGDVDGDGDVDGEDIRRLTAEDAARLMRRHFWDALGLDEVKPLCAMVVYDTAVNMGPSFARKMAQKALGVAADGVWGPVTRAALRVCDDAKTAAAMCHIRRARCHDMAQGGLKVFLKGWLRRVDDLEKTVESAAGTREAPVTGQVVVRRLGPGA